jgi:hypothetical protein
MIAACDATRGRALGICSASRVAGMAPATPVTVVLHQWGRQLIPRYLPWPPKVREGRSGPDGTHARQQLRALRAHVAADEQVPVGQCCPSDYVGSTSGVPQKAEDPSRRPIRLPWAKSSHSALSKCGEGTRRESFSAYLVTRGFLFQRRRPARRP